MDRRPFEIIAECELAGFPTSEDVDRITGLIAAARKSQPEIVRAAVTPPAVFRGRHYVLESRLIVWAEDSAGALKVAKALMKEAGVRCRAVLPSGRAMAQAEVPPMPKPGKGKGQGREPKAKTRRR